MDRCCQAKKITGDYDGLKQLTLMEEFQNGMPEELKAYLNERKIESSYDMTILADEYNIVHRKPKPKTTVSTPRQSQNARPNEDARRPGPYPFLNNRPLFGREIRQVT